MDDRLIEFVRGLRAAGVRVSVAEAADAADAMGTIGLRDKALFRQAMRATMVKDADGFAAFDALFPLYFGSGGPPLQNALEQLAPDDQELVKATATRRTIQPRVAPRRIGDVLARVPRRRSPGASGARCPRRRGR